MSQTLPDQDPTKQPKEAQIIELLDAHHDAFYITLPFATKTDHPVPMDTRAWSQILVSVVTGIKGVARKKGADFIDGSDVKAANCWEAIDTPRFNGVIKAGTQAKYAGSLDSLKNMPHLFFVLWDHSPATKRARCRVWAVRPKSDKKFRTMCDSWYAKRTAGDIKSNNFQLHPPRNNDSNIFTNTCGNLDYPLLLSAERKEAGFEILTYAPEVLSAGTCKIAPEKVSLGKKKRVAKKASPPKRKRS